jgi:hypothetical protein
MLRRLSPPVVLLLACAVLPAAEPSNARKPKDDAELKYWLQNMVWHHRFSTDEIADATGLTRDAVAAALKQFDIRPDNRPTHPARPFLPRLCDVVRAELHIGTLYRPDCCIAATAILNEVLDYFKLTARPLSAIATVFNPVMSERIAQEGMPTLEEAGRNWFPKGCYSLAVGAGDPDPGKWPGHLVAVLGGRVLIDLTLDQANRPQHGIVLPVPIIAPCDAEFLAGQAVVAGIVGGCRVVYEARPGDRS